MRAQEGLEAQAILVMDEGYSGSNDIPPRKTKVLRGERILSLRAHHAKRHGLFAVPGVGVEHGIQPGASDQGAEQRKEEVAVGSGQEVPIPGLELKDVAAH